VLLLLSTARILRFLFHRADDLPGRVRNVFAPPPGPSDLTVLAGAATSHPVAGVHAVQPHPPMPLARPSPPPQPPSTELGRAIPGSQYDGRHLEHSTTIVGSGLTAYIIECGPLRGNHGSCSNSASGPYLSTAVGGTGLYRNPDGKSTIDPRAIFHHAVCKGAERNPMTANGLRKGARMVFEIALEELFIEGKIADADFKYSFEYKQTNVGENAVDLDGVPWNRVECFDLAFVLLRLASFVWAICASSRRQSGPNECFANQTLRDQRFALAMLVLLAG
jgi:hypothetical protein